MVNAIGTQILQAIAIAGSDLQVRMLQALGLKSTLITDSSNPINLLETAQGLQPYKKKKIDE
jgi:major vault protein